MFSSRKTAAPSTGYNLTKSLRFRSSAFATLSRTPASASNQQKWTLSAWVKRGTVYDATLDNYIFGAGSSGSNRFLFGFGNTTENLAVVATNSGSNVLVLNTTPVYRDPSAWYHMVLAVDTTQATASNRVILYVNGVQVTAFSTATYPAQNTNLVVNATNAHAFGSRGYAASDYYDGYMTEINFIDGQQLTPSSFGSTNALTGVWQPAKYTGTYGTNGFYLPFTNTASTTTLGYDFSGNSNNWTTNNISLTAGSTYDSMTDVPTLTSATQGNYSVLNPLQISGVPSFSGSVSKTFTNGNLNIAWGTGSYCGVTSTFIVPSSGKWYWECTLQSANISTGISPSYSEYPSGSENNIRVDGSGIYTNGSSAQSGLAGYTTGDILGMAWNADTNSMQYYKNGSTYGTAQSYTKTTGVNYFPFFLNSTSVSSQTANVNFGQQPFSYTPPTGFVALNTYNLPTSTIVKGNTVMDATLYTGTLLSNAITNTAGFKPDLVWIKSRSAATDNKLTDSVRGTTKGLISNTTGAETTDTQGLTAFGTNGFTVGTNTDYNNLTATYVGWQWQAGQGSSSSNTSGSITSTVSVNASAGFSVVTWTDSASTYTVGHGLGVAPQFIILKDRSNAYNWDVGCNAIGWANRLKLNDTTATSAGYWNSTAPTSSVFTYIGNGTGNMVAYCWTPIAGFSAFGSYTGNGSTDGPFVYTGFRPKFVLLKRTDNVGDWYMLDTSRDPYNLATQKLMADLSVAENGNGESTSTNTLDILSNGYKLRSTNTASNQSSGTYIYMAFAENPQKFSLAR